MTDLSLAAPVDDGAAEHLPGLELPPIELVGAEGASHVLGKVESPWLVLYVYPRTGGPSVDLPEDWDAIPGARGCTPQSCEFRDHQSELKSLGATVWGLSAQPIEEQRGFRERMHIPFPLLNDSSLELAKDPLRLPTFHGGGLRLYKRITMLIRDAVIEKVFYPVFPPEKNAGEVLAFLNQSED